MNAVSMLAQQTGSKLQSLVEQAASQIAPAWPLDQMIAVNPWWPKRQHHFADVCAEQQLLAGTSCLMTADWYLAQWQQQIQPAHLQQALHEAELQITVDEAVAVLSQPDDLRHWQSLAQLLSEQTHRQSALPWPQLIQQQLSQFMGLYYQYPERFSVAAASNQHSYQSWLSVVRQDKGLQVLSGINLTTLFATLPVEPSALLQQLECWLESWCADEQAKLAYLENLLQSLSGWAGWQAWLDWQQQLNKQQSHNAVCQLLYMLLGWDWVLWQHSKRHNAAHDHIITALKQQSRQYSAMLLSTQTQLTIRQVWQRALEFSVQLPLFGQLQQAARQPVATPARPVLQAAFCIDVRSEPMRRVLEQQNAGIQTLGFAGFFGLPIAYKAADSKLSRPQLPGLLAPVLQVSQIRPEKTTLPRQPALGWKQSFDLASSSLGMVEAAGATKLLSLLKRAFFRTKAPHAMNRYLDDGQWQLSKDQQPLSVAEQAQLAAAILPAMGLGGTLAATVLLVGHGSETCNNPQAAALDCGACGGQTGEVNVKVLAQILNNSEVRAELACRHDLAIPADTRFYAAMHQTTTDTLQVFQPPVEADWLHWLAEAGKKAREQRASQFAEAPAQASALRWFFKLRSRDWAQLRPEWGLANNAAFIVAPRTLTKTLNLQGRCFLHDYNAEHDADFSLLHTIMTAPMVVTNWINMQYYASVVAPDKYGSGNKLLHNVVAGHIGVFEGNGGDLRTGLSWQSVHDGTRLRHQPVRLSVIIAAPQQAIADVIKRSDDVAALVNNQWLWLYQLDSDGTLHQWQQARWQQVTV
ncbi:MULTISPECIES: DUF2309 domain-containing protein [unclassified Arsukibacterium]|uniref:DUF2309 domain-containing protein n=1 Tax=unclassified Arsukibacterium TaxID=2635278 RepID=UPI000C6738EF|nr:MULTISPECIES: DUF2309 domain-containing protein [unclassified Arsukibacterium]MBM32839.1 DUF2309 domain-containing protein [Rheinheimera sp.]|tara:strand:+ start:17616 stop:20036 length:2421 start_codon:yes stop_codon:yes gene_type:complete